MEAVIGQSDLVKFPGLVAWLLFLVYTDQREQCTVWMIYTEIRVR